MSATYFAQVTNEIVTAVHCVSQEFMDENPDRYPGTWVETFIDVPGKLTPALGFLMTLKPTTL